MSIGRLEELKSLIAKLQGDRQAHLDAIAQIDEAFATLGIKVQVEKRGRQRGAPLAGVKKRRRRRKFKITGAESIIGFVKAAGGKGVTGGQIVQHWRAEGRGASCYNMLGKLIKAKKIKRHKLKGQKGSAYTAG
jgi:hypothetical protein